LRRELKNPLGLLLRGSFEETIKRLEEIVETKKPKRLIAVGDVVSSNILREGMRLDVAIVDNKVMRKPIAPLDFRTEKTYHVRNLTGTLSDESWQVIREAIEYGGQTKVLVEGEEDLLTLIAVLHAPVGSIVVYGQPGEGIVVIEVTDPTKEKVQRIVNRMKVEP